MKNIPKIRYFIITIISLFVSHTKINAQSIVEIADMNADHLTINSDQKNWKSYFSAKGYFDGQFANLFYSTTNQQSSNGLTRFGIGIQNSSNYSNNTGLYIEALTILPNGFTGIGTASPSEKLHVMGNLRFEANGSGVKWNNFSKIFDDAQLRILTDDNLYFGKLNSDGNMGASTMYMNVDNGKVGIGTESPTEKLQVIGNGQFSGLKVSGNTRFGNNAGGLVWGGYDSNQNTFSDNTYYSRIKDDGQLRILTDDHLFIGKLNGDGSNGNTTMYANVDNGKVGIGTESPTEKLQVDGNIQLGQSDLSGAGGVGNYLSFSNYNNNSDPIYFQRRNNSANLSSLNLYLGDDPNNDASDNFNILATNATSPALTVNSNGLVGIGREIKAGNALAVKGSLDITDSNNYSIFHVSTGKNRVFVGRDAYSKYTDTAAKTDGTINANDYSLWVSQGVNATDFAMSDITSWNDFVFANEYKLPTLKETESYITTNKHLPYIPSEADVIKNGYSLHNMNRGFLQTIEEMTLHSIEQEKKIDALSSELAEIKAMLLAKK